jgi:hypothetical protein
VLVVEEAGVPGKNHRPHGQATGKLYHLRLLVKCTLLSNFIYMFWGPGGSMSYVVGSNNSYKPITNTAWARTQLCKLQKGYTQLAAASDKVYQLLVQGRWFSPGTRLNDTFSNFSLK